MKAISYHRYGGPEVIQIEELPEPTLQQGQVKIRVHSLSINPYDGRFMRGKPFFLRLQYGLFKPKTRVLGNDIAGEVIEVATGVTSFQLGDKVIAASKLGGFAEVVCVAQDRVALAPSSDSMNAAAGMIMAATTAYDAVHRYAQLQAGERVLINGASGGVGHFAVQIAHAVGAHVTGVCSTSNIEFVKSLGARNVIDYKQGKLDALNEEFDCLIDVNGNLNISQYQRLVQPNGRIAVVGYHGMADMMSKLWHERFGRPKLKVVIADESNTLMQRVVALAESGKLKTHISRCYSLNDFAEAIDHLEQGHTVAKVIVEMPVDGNRRTLA